MDDNLHENHLYIEQLMFHQIAQRTLGNLYRVFEPDV